MWRVRTCRCVFSEVSDLWGYSTGHILIIFMTVKREGRKMKYEPSPAHAISHPSTAQGGGRGTTPRAVSPLIELELREKNEHVAARRSD